MSGERDKARESLEVDEEPWQLSLLDEEIDALIELEGNPDRLRDCLTWGRFTVRRMIHYAQPPGDSLSWELWLDQGGTQVPLWFGGEFTHDLGAIKAEILANREEIAGRMRALARARAEVREKTQGIEQGI